jgi:hypothetical protein
VLGIKAALFALSDEQAEPGCAEPISFSVLRPHSVAGRHARLLSMLGTLRAPSITSKEQLSLASEAHNAYKPQTRRIGCLQPLYAMITLSSPTYCCGDINTTVLIYIERHTRDPFSITTGAMSVNVFATTSTV